MTTACGGGSKPSTVENIQKQTESVVEAKSVSSGWESNDYTKQVPKPDISISAAGESQLGYSANFNNATLEQVKAYAAKVKEAGFNIEAYEGDGDMYSYSAKNAAGYGVYLNWAQGQAGVLISKLK
ncbi:hypothetical protein AGMMS49574_02050 [Bacteroidia bacterium]|nr:hypothetical protein AGMMS49574_02050 [Bacteroidia bacterium]